MIRKNTPGLASEALYYAGLYASRLLNRPLVAPYQAVLYVTEACNSRCAMCDVWKGAKARAAGPRSMYASEGGRQPVLGLDEYRALFAQLAALGIRETAFSGGEPLLRKDLAALLEEARNRGMETLVLSNGLSLDAEAAAMLRDAGVSRVGLSLDGPDAATNAVLRGREDAFERTIEAVRHLKKAGIPVSLNTTIQPENVARLTRIHDVCVDLGVAGVTFTPVHEGWFSGNRKGAGDSDDADARLRVLREQVAALRARRQRFGLIQNSDRYLREIPSFVAGPGFKNVTCYVDFLRFTVMADGTLTFCTAEFTFGDVRTAPIETQLRSDATRAVRRRVRQAKCPPCWLGCFAELNLLFSPRAAAVRKFSRLFGRRTETPSVYS